ncbi:MAG: matrixin family metalloprotease [Dehalococcoidia bacterium]
MRWFSAVVAVAALFAALFGIFGGAQASPGTAANADGLLPGEVLERAEFALFDARSAPEGTVLAGAPDLAAFTATGRWADSALPVPVRYVFATDPKEISAFGSLLWALRRWEAVGGQKLRASYAGAFATGPGTTCTDRQRDNVNTVSFSKLDPKLLGTTCVFFANVPGTQTRRILEFDMELTTDAAWSASETTQPSAFDLPTVVLHEMGHAIGLGHTAVTGTVMQEALAPGTQFRVPAQDDRDGLISLYGDAAAPTVTPMALPPASFATRRLPALARE